MTFPVMQPVSSVSRWSKEKHDYIYMHRTNIVLRVLDHHDYICTSICTDLV